MSKTISKDAMSLSDFLTEEYGPIGTKERDDFELGVELSIIGSKLEEARTNKKFKINQLSAKTGLSKEAIRKIEAGDRDIAYADIKRAFNALGIEVSLVIED